MARRLADAFVDVAPEAPAGAVRVDDERPAVRGHRRALRHGERQAHVFVARDSGRRLVDLSAREDQVGRRVRLEDGERDQRLELVERGVGRRGARAGRPSRRRTERRRRRT